MKRVTSACLLQTMRFDNTNGADPQTDLDAYIKKLERSKTKYAIEQKMRDENGSLIVKIKKQYISYSAAGYID